MIQCYYHHHHRRVRVESGKWQAIDEFIIGDEEGEGWKERTLPMLFAVE
jgi:hypothetical protein